MCQPSSNLKLFLLLLPQENHDFLELFPPVTRGSQRVDRQQ